MRSWKHAVVPTAISISFVALLVWFGLTSPGFLWELAKQILALVTSIAIAVGLWMVAGYAGMLATHRRRMVFAGSIILISVAFPFLFTWIRDGSFWPSWGTIVVYLGQVALAVTIVIVACLGYRLLDWISPKEKDT